MRFKLLLLCLLLLCLDAKELQLEATISYTNNTKQDVGIIHKLTIPKETYFQKLRSIKVVPNSAYSIKQHPNKEERYIELSFNLPADATKVSKVLFTLDLNATYVDIQKHFSLNTDKEKTSQKFTALANLVTDAKDSDFEKLKRIYTFAAQYLQYQRNPASKPTPLQALKSGVGDCTEYAMLFVELARHAGIKARVSSSFHYTKRKKFTMPNHHIAEIYVDTFGWFPIYPNLSAGEFDNAFSLGNISDLVLIYKSDVWTWANVLPKNVQKKISVTQSWEVFLP